MRSSATIRPVEPAPAGDGALPIARLAGWALVLGLVAAAAWAVVVLLSEDVNETDARVVLTSLAFAAASTTGASGVAATLRASPGMRLLGVATIACSIAAFALFAAAIWKDEPLYGAEVLWRACGCASVLAIAGGHASLMLRARRPTDGALIEIVTFSSLALGLIDTVGALLPLSELIERVDESWARVLGSVLVLLIVTTVVAPLLRRLQPAAPPVDSGTATVLAA
jgi:hypothetical protein